MRQKIGTALHTHLVVRLKEAAEKNGRAMNELIEEALEQYLAMLESGQRMALVDSTAGKYKVSKEQFAMAMDEDVHGS